jgi:hypothetical protein
MMVRLVWPSSVEKRNGYARIDSKPRDNPALRIPLRPRIVINGVAAFYEFVSHNAGMALRHLSISRPSPRNRIMQDLPDRRGDFSG